MLENVREFVAEHPGTARMHYFNVRGRAGETLLVTKYMPKHAHKFLNESAMPAILFGKPCKKQP